MNRVDDIINRGRRAGKPDQEIMDNVIKNVQSRSTEYANATNTQQEQIIRDIREKFGAKEKKAPSVRKVTGTPKNKVETDEMAALKSQIRLEARAARDAKKDLNGKRQMLAEMINDLARQGRITSRQAASLVAKSNKINLDNPVMIDRFIAYADKVFEDAEYADKLSVAKATRKKIKKLSKNKDKPANLTDLAKKFADIDPSYISDIDEYNRVASEFADGLVGSRARAEKVKISNGIIESDVSSYMATAMQEQEQAILEQKKAEIEALGIDAADMTIEQMNEILAKGEKITKYNESIVRDVLNNAFRIYGSIVNSMIESGVDPFTGEDISGGFTEKQKQIVKKFMDMDLNILTTKEALAAIDSLMNFMYNNSTAGMEATVAFYEGELNARKAERSGVSGKPLKMYWSPKIGRMFGEQFANLPVLVERIFKGFTAGQKIKRLMGLSDLTVGKSTAEKTSNNIVSAYVSKFYKTKPNGQKFNTRFNNVERGMLGFMSRNINGTPEEVTAEFQRRKGVVEESIARLMQGNKDEIKKGQIYQDVYERILEDSESIEDVSSKADAINKEAVEWWMNEWASKYDQMADLSLNVYNRNLGSDINYTPDRFSRMMSGGERVDVNELESSFEYNNNTTYMKEAGSLMKAIRPDKDQLSDGLYIDLSFDNVNSSAMYDALIDIHTAYPIRQISGFINSDSFKKLIPNAETRDVLVKRINLAIRSMKSKMPYDDSELSSFFKKLDKITKFGVSQALGGVLQPVKQTVPAMMNTLVNSGRFDLSSSFNKSIQSFIDRSGYAIANRGIESLANVSKINKIIEQASESTGQKAMDLIEKANEMWLKVFLVAPDVFVARASWMTYYEKSLRNQGIDVSTIDWDTHEINEEAGDYAQLMVDRQQNISDSDLSGKFFKSENPVQKFITRTAFGFSGFRLNQTMRLVTDITVLTSKSATAEDKKIAAASASGFAVEMLTFRLISGYAAFMLGSLTLQMMGREEDEEEKKKRRNNIINGQLTGSIQDLISPIPPVDVPVSMAASAVAGYIQDEMNVDDENRLTIYGNTKREYLQSFGSMGVTAGTLGDIIDLTKLGITGAYEDQYGREKEISEEDKDMMLYMAGLTALSAVSLAPAEARSISRNAEKFAKRKSETEERRVKQQEQKEKTEKEFLKKYNPDEYERIYGKGSPTYEIEQQLKKIESNIRKQMKQED
jgi:hypothetical protein